MGIRLLVQSSRAASDAEAARYEFDQERIVLGRGAGADVQLPHPQVSIKHATLRVRGAGYVVVDEGSTNGTRVGSERLPPGRPKVLEAGHVLWIGPFRVEVEVGVPVASPTSAEGTAALARDLLRRALGGDDAQQRPRLVVLNGAREGVVVELPEPPATWRLGRGDDAELSFDDADMSRHHVELVSTLSGYEARDLDSKNGLWVNGRRLRSRRLTHGDELELGGTLLLYEDPVADSLRELVAAEDELAPEPEPEPDPPPSSETGANREDDESQDAREDVGPEDEAETPTREGAGSSQASATLAAAPRPPRRASGGADWIIYVFAAAVLLASLMSLFWLYSS